MTEWLSETSLADRAVLATCVLAGIVVVGDVALGDAPLTHLPIVAIGEAGIYLGARSAVAERRLSDPERMIELVLDDDGDA